MDNESIKLGALDLIRSGMPEFATPLKRDQGSCCANRSPEKALQISITSAWQDANRETHVILLLWLCCLWQISAAFIRVLA